MKPLSIMLLCMAVLYGFAFWLQAQTAAPMPTSTTLRVLPQPASSWIIKCSPTNCEISPQVESSLAQWAESHCVAVMVEAHDVVHKKAASGDLMWDPPPRELPWTEHIPEQTLKLRCAPGKLDTEVLPTIPLCESLQEKGIPCTPIGKP